MALVVMALLVMAVWLSGFWLSMPEAKPKTSKVPSGRAENIHKSQGEATMESKLPKEGIGDSRMTESIALALEIGKLLLENANRQIENNNRQIDFLKKSELANMGRFKELIEGQQRAHKQDVKILVDQLQEQTKLIQLYKVPIFDGITMDMDDWKDIVEAVMKCNRWTFENLMEVIPIYLTGAAKRAFDALTNMDKRSKDIFFKRMRVKISPQSEERNMELFMTAKREQMETIMMYIDRCKMYLRRSGGDPNEHFTVGILKGKVEKCLTSPDKKILNASLETSDDLDTMIVKADRMLNSQIEEAAIRNEQTEAKSITMVKDKSPEPVIPEKREGYNSKARGNRGRENMRVQSGSSSWVVVCWKCGKIGHLRRDCSVWLSEHGSNERTGIQIDGHRSVETGLIG